MTEEEDRIIFGNGYFIGNGISHGHGRGAPLGFGGGYSWQNGEGYGCGFDGYGTWEDFKWAKPGGSGFLWRGDFRGIYGYGRGGWRGVGWGDFFCFAWGVNDE